MKMTNEQRHYINAVILPTLVDMAINDELDSDLNLLSYHDFEEATEKFNNSPEQVKARRLKTMGDYFCEDDDEGITLESQLEILESFEGDKWTQIGTIEGLIPWDGLEHKAIGDIWNSLPN